MFTTRHLFKAVPNDREMTVRATLTFPVADAAGDIVSADGGNFKPHVRANAWVGLEHLRWDKSLRDVVYPDDHRSSGRPVIVGSAFARRGDEDSYTLHYRDATHEGRTARVPCGTTHFDPHNEIEAQTYVLISKGIFDGVSLEFCAARGHAPRVLKARSPLEPHRPAWEFQKWDALAWVHCKAPVNKYARTYKAVVGARLDTVRTVLSRGRLDARPIHPTLFKAMKKMEEDDEELMTTYDAAAQKAGLVEDGGGGDGDADNDDDDYFEDGDEFGAPDADLLDADLSELVASIDELRRVAAGIVDRMRQCDAMPEGVAKARRAGELLRSHAAIAKFAGRLRVEAVRRTLAGEV